LPLSLAALTATADDTQPGGVQDLTPKSAAPSPAAPSPAAQDPLLDPPRTELRPRGFALGVAGHAGVVGGVDGLTPALGLSFQFGWQFHRRLAVAVDWSGVSPARDVLGTPDYLLGHFAVAARYWAGPRLWLEAGTGAGGIDLNGDAEVSGRTDAGWALFAGVGMEALQRAGFALDVSIRTESFVLRDDQYGLVLAGVGVRLTGMGGE